jgi:very-short-patch-repair endonuclease
MHNEWNPGYIGNKIKTGHRTDIEAMAEQVLRQLDIPYKFEQKIGRYYADFVLDTLGVILECDGWQHQLPGRSQKDAEKDAYLTSRGWIVVRIADKLLRLDAYHAISTALSNYLHPTINEIAEEVFLLPV